MEKRADDVGMLAYKYICISAYWHTDFETGVPRFIGKGIGV